MQRGEKLPNGATLIDETRLDGGTTIVLASVPVGIPFATWAYYRDDPKTTSNGHYFEEISAAAYSYEIRIKRGY